MVSAARQVWFAPAGVRIRHWPARLASHGPAGRSRPPGRSAPRSSRWCVCGWSRRGGGGRRCGV